MAIVVSLRCHKICQRKTSVFFLNRYQLELCRCYSIKSLIKPFLTYISLMRDSTKTNKQTPKQHLFKRDRTTSSTFINCQTLNNEHNWEDLYLQSRINKHAPPSNHVASQIPYTTQASLCQKPNHQKSKDVKNKPNNTHISSNPKPSIFVRKVKRLATLQKIPTTLQPEVSVLDSRKYSRCTRIVSDFTPQMHQNIGMETNQIETLFPYKKIVKDSCTECSNFLACFCRCLQTNILAYWRRVPLLVLGIS